MYTILIIGGMVVLGILLVAWVSASISDRRYEEWKSRKRAAAVARGSYRSKPYVGNFGEVSDIAGDITDTLVDDNCHHIGPSDSYDSGSYDSGSSFDSGSCDCSSGGDCGGGGGD